MSIGAENVSWKVGNKVIVDNVSLTVSPAQPSGYSALMALESLHCCACLLAFVARTRVRLRWMARRCAILPKQLARRIAYVEQHAATEANMRVREVVKLGRIPHHSPFPAGAGRTIRLSMKRWKEWIC